MSQDENRDHNHDGRRQDPNAGRETPGQQDRPMNEQEKIDTASNDSMDASDPPSTPPGKNEPVPSSGFAEEKDAVPTSAIGGVQGTSPSEAEGQAGGEPLRAGSPPDEPVPDAGEIEWAGGVIKKAPAPDR